MDLEFGVEVRDDVGVGRVYVEYWLEDGGHHTADMVGVSGYNVTVQLPRRTGSTLRYQFHAVDTSGNTNSTGERLVLLVNIVPKFLDIPAWNVTEEQVCRLNLTDYIKDLNDAPSGLVLACNASNITVDGLVLIANFEDWRPSHVIHLTVSDGDDEARAMLTVNVVNVNDPPVIRRLLSPSDGAIIPEGRTVTFDAEYYDPDTVQGDELEVTWTSSIDGELARYRVDGSGQFVAANLSEGQHRITVTLSDGEQKDTYEFQITVEGKTQWTVGKTVFLIIILIIVIIASIILIFKYRQSLTMRG